MSISRKCTRRVYQSFTTVAHRLNKVGYKSRWNSIPLLYNGIFQLLHVYGWVWSVINPSLEFIPNMFNWGHVWWHWSPIQLADIVICNKPRCDYRCMWPSTILLHNTVSYGEIVLLERNHNICQHFIHIQIGVHVAVENNKTLPVVSCNSSPYMYGSTVTSVCLHVSVAARILSRRWFTLICRSWRWVVDVEVDMVVLVSGSLLHSLFGGRVVPGALLSIHCSQTLLQCFVWFNPPWTLKVLCFFHFLRAMAWPYRNLFNIN